MRSRCDAIFWISPSSVDQDPPLTAYVSLELGRKVADAPDAWCYLRESYARQEKDRNKPRPIKNFERWLHQRVVPAVVFGVSAFIAFATGTSWGTFAIMMPIAVPMANLLQVPLAPTVAAVLGGGVFGDHCSPISDTTIIASMASACDHIDHVRTQLPYALVAAGASLVLYLVVGVLW